MWPYPILVAVLGFGPSLSSDAQITTGEQKPPTPLIGPVGGTRAVSPDPLDSIDVENIAKIPYEALIKIAQSDASQSKDAKIYTLRISSKIETVKPSQIELFLDREAAPQVLRVDPNGYFMVPNTEELMTENPDLVSNQPKGSLNLEVKLSLPKPELPEITDGRVRYKALFEPILTLNESMQKMDPNFGKPGQQQFAISIEAGAEGWVKLQREFGSRTMSPDPEGRIWIIYDLLLFEENPEIQIMPNDAELTVRPVTAAQAADIRAR